MKLITFLIGTLRVITPGLLCVVLLAYTSNVDSQEITADPYENSNRRVYKFNNALDSYFLLPLSQGYDFVTPPFIQAGATNFFSNAGEPYVMFNDMLQLKMVSVYQGAARVSINTVIGLLGLVDVAAYMGLPRHSEDLGQTLGTWGVPAGPYLEVPFLGTSTSRDVFPTIVETFYAPRLALLELDSAQRWGLAFIGILNARNNLRGVEQIIIGDRYTFLRDAYLQNREYQVRDGQISWDAIQLDGLNEDTDELDELDELEELDELDALPE